VRGHTYEIRLQGDGFAESSLNNGASADFFALGDRIRWLQLSVTAGQDPFEAIADLQSQIDDLAAENAAQDLRLDGLEGRVDDLEDRVDGIEDRVDDREEGLGDLAGVVRRLIEFVRTHTHEYLTGKGRGHNNTKATTQPPGAAMPRVDEGPEVSREAPPEQEWPEALAEKERLEALVEQRRQEALAEEANRQAEEQALQEADEQSAGRGGRRRR
jgi:hypothetical protein